MTEAQSAAFNTFCLFSAAGKVRTHQAIQKDLPRVKNKTIDRRRIPKMPGVGRGGNQGKPVEIAGRTYRSMKAACTALHIGHARFYEMLDTGKAKRCITQRS